MKRAGKLGVTAVIMAVFSVCLPAQDTAMTGYTEKAAAAERRIEESFKAIPSPEDERKQHRIFTAEPHPAGSARNNDLARYIEQQWREQGWEDVRLHRYDVLVSYPREVKVEMVIPRHYEASLREDGYDVDPDTKNPAVRGGYLALSTSGEVTAPLVYAHSGNPEDYDLLMKHGIDVRGKVVLVRYSNPYSYRGFKALTAQQRGVAALIVYSDPAEDGYKRGKVFPDGPWGPDSHIQRGSVTYDFLVAGDPLTPGWASVEGAKRIPRSEARSLPNILAVAMSWRDAKPLLESLDGPVAPKSWQGGLPIRYRLGGGAPQVHIKIDMDTSIQPNYVVEARIRGTEFPDEWVLVGNHRDAWEFGGVDPSSGTASMMELTRGLGELLKQGVRPKRTIVACSWDGEEIGLTGSTEWGEEFADELQKKLVAYLNVDSSTSGPDFQGSAVASLAPVLMDVTRTVKDPSGVPLFDAWKKSRAKELRESGDKSPVSGANLVDVRIGSGSDHTVFLNHLGRPVVGLSFDGPYGVYHSVYDDFYWMNHFGDPGYRYHTLMSQLWGTLALRLANANVLPLDFAFYGARLRDFMSAIEKYPQAGKELDLKAAYQRIAEFEEAGKRLNTNRDAALARNELPADEAPGVNRDLMQVESNWLIPDGIPDRPWFKHSLYAARYTYAHLELPGITEAVEKGQWETARHQLQIVNEQVARNTELLNKAAMELEKSQAKSKTGGAQ